MKTKMLGAALVAFGIGNAAHAFSKYFDNCYIVEGRGLIAHPDFNAPVRYEGSTLVCPLVPKSESIRH